MAAKKTTKKTAAKTATKKVTKKTATKKTTKKTAKKDPKKTAKESKKVPKKVPKKVSTKAESAPDETAKVADAEKAGQAPASRISSQDVNMSHVFALRPRATTSFKAGDFSAAKHQLQDEPYSDIHEAARAVVDKALELTHGIRNKGRRRRF